MRWLASTRMQVNLAESAQYIYIMLSMRRALMKRHYPLNRRLIGSPIILKTAHFIMLAYMHLLPAIPGAIRSTWLQHP
jgi:hypothetical protein